MIHRHVCDMCDMCDNYNHYSNTNLHIKRMYGRPEGQRQDVQSEGADEDWGTITVVQVTHHPPVFLPLTGYIQVYNCVCMCTPYSTEYFLKLEPAKDDK